jgi:hypothetical protein
MRTMPNRDRVIAPDGYGTTNAEACRTLKKTPGPEETQP